MTENNGKKFPCLVQFFNCCNACSLVPHFHQLYQDLINSKENALTEKNAQQ